MIISFDQSASAFVVSSWVDKTFLQIVTPFLDTSHSCWACELITWWVITRAHITADKMVSIILLFVSTIANSAELLLLLYNLDEWWSTSMTLHMCYQYLKSKFAKCLQTTAVMKLRTFNNCECDENEIDSGMLFWWWDIIIE